MLTYFLDKARRFAKLPPPVQTSIRVEGFARAADVPYAASHHVDLKAAMDGSLRCELARTDRLRSAAFQRWLAGLNRTPMCLHRKEWELAYILQALDERGMILAGAKGLGFAVGREPVPAFLAAQGCQITATDLHGSGEGRAQWSDSGQWSGSLDELTFPDICPPETMATRVTFRPVDMNAIPQDLRGYDFTWSTCSFEHCGSLALGADFVVNQMACLRPGGVAVHTTEFNLSSNTDTQETGNTVIYRLKDIEALVRRLRQAGHDVEPLDIWPGDDPADRHVCTPNADGQHPGKVHMRLLVHRWAATSIGLIIRKKAADPA